MKKLERPGIMNKVRLYIGEDRFNIYFRIYDIPLLCSGKKKKADTHTLNMVFMSSHFLMRYRERNRV